MGKKHFICTHTWLNEDAKKQGTEFTSNMTEKELNDHWEVLTEPMQTAIRKSGKESGYEQMMDLSRGKKIS